ncbi:hypothetical protein B0675_02130 [Streptomyces sp. M41(2017)]|uniref:hypothetical protein n=1 Tax=Streptomyces sp. M41(2017) TaxID=1955065 RepID=UPI0009C0DBB8|nr:hypothetical protein [Streptomyces sp. M41(2017)]OQQ16105.1 hypothetical protein B0675_02130 [Streptomyces sp. M41(2017)]
MTQQPHQEPELTGPAGSAFRVPDIAENPAVLEQWIITARDWHPIWYQYLLALISLADMPDMPPANRHRKGVTHELVVFALDPEDGPLRPETFVDRRPTEFVLTPANVVEQVTTTDDQARHLTRLCANAVVHGRLIPETGDSPDHIRAMWRTSISQTLDHSRDPHHGRAN